MGTANEERCKEMVHNSIGIVTALLPHIGYKNCTNAADRALKERRPVADLVVEMGFWTRPRWLRSCNLKTCVVPQPKRSRWQTVIWMALRSSDERWTLYRLEPFRWFS